MSDDYLRDNGYKVTRYNHDAFGVNHAEPNETVVEYTKTFDDEYTIIVRHHTNFYGGKTVIDVRLHCPKDLAKPKVSYHHMAAPSISFFATGYQDYPALEKKVKEEIVPSLKRWAIEVI